MCTLLSVQILCSQFICNITTVILHGIVNMHCANRNIIWTSQMHTIHKLHSLSVHYSIFKQAFSCLMWLSFMLETHTNNALLLKQVWNFLEQVGILQKKSKVHCNPKIKDWTGKFVFLWMVPLELKVPKTTQSILNAGCSTVTDWWAKWFWPKIKVVNFLCVLMNYPKA